MKGIRRAHIKNETTTKTTTTKGTTKRNNKKEQQKGKTKGTNVHRNPRQNSISTHAQYHRETKQHHLQQPHKPHNTTYPAQPPTTKPALPERHDETAPVPPAKAASKTPPKEGRDEPVLRRSGRSLACRRTQLLPSCGTARWTPGVRIEKTRKSKRR